MKRIFHRHELAAQGECYFHDVLSGMDKEVAMYNHALIRRYGKDGLRRIKEVAWRIAREKQSGEGR